MQEFDLGNGRTLIAAYGGIDYEKYSTSPQVAYGILDTTFKDIANKLLDKFLLSLGINMRKYDRYDYAYPSIHIQQENIDAESEVRDLIEALKTARLELAWLHGDSDTVQLILGGQTNG